MSPMKRLVIALVLLVLAVTMIVLVNKGVIGGESASKTPEPTTTAPLFSASVVEEVTKVQVKDNTTGSLVVAEKKDGNWTILEAPKDSDTGLGVDQERISNALVSVPSLQPSRTLSGIEALATYGLGDKAQYMIALTIGDQPYTLTVGSKNPGAMDYYVQLGEISDVYLVSTYYLDPVIELLTTPPYIQPTPDPNVTPSATPEEDVTGR